MYDDIIMKIPSLWINRKVRPIRLFWLDDSNDEPEVNKSFYDLFPQEHLLCRVTPELIKNISLPEVAVSSPFHSSALRFRSDVALLRSSDESLLGAREAIRRSSAKDFTLSVIIRAYPTDYYILYILICSEALLQSHELIHERCMMCKWVAYDVIHTEL